MKARRKMDPAPPKRNIDLDRACKATDLLYDCIQHLSLQPQDDARFVKALRLCSDAMIYLAEAGVPVPTLPRE